MSIKILAVSDIHPRMNGSYAGRLILDPSTGYSLAFEDIRKSLRAVLDWENLNPCDVAVIPGDVFDVAKPSPAEYALIGEFLLTLLDRMSIIVIAGNHDIDQNAAVATALEPLKFLAQAHRKSKAPHELHIMTEPNRVLIQTAKGPVCVSGLPFPSKGKFQASGATNGDAPEVVLSKINQALRDLVEGMSGGLHPTAINIMLAHGTVSNAQVGEQPRSISHDLMIPVDAMHLYDAVFLGHIHRHQLVAENAFYIGSLACQTIGEAKEIKGWCAVEVERGQPSKITHIPNPHSRIFTDLDIVGLDACADLWSPDGVYRIVGEVTEAEYPEACLAVATFEAAHPFTQNNLEITRHEDRARDAGMTALLTEEEAVERVVRTLVEEGAVQGVMQMHQEIVEVTT